MLVRDTQLILGTQHSKRKFTPDFGLLDLEIPGKHDTHTCKGSLIAHLKVRGATDDLELFGSVKHTTQPQAIGAGMGFHMTDLADNNASIVTANGCDALNFNPRERQLVTKLLWRGIEIHILAQPTNGNLHRTIS